jgi:hypothetical protein
MNFLYVDKLRLTTPKATLKYPKLIEPETKFSPEGHYKVTAVIPADEADYMSAQLDALYEAHKASLKAQAPGQKFKAVDPSFGYEDIDGKPCFTISVKMKAKGMDRDGRAWSAAPALFDASGAPVKDRDALRGMWSGTTGRVSFEACPFYQPAIGAGITLRLKAVQILDLVESGGSANSFGFQEEAGWASGETQTVVEGDASAMRTNSFDHTTRSQADEGFDF